MKGGGEGGPSRRTSSPPQKINKKESIVGVTPTLPFPVPLHDG